jgi:uncharacterized damage-inducible protein DinB
MAARFLEDAFHHHVWATFRLLDACAALTPEQLATTVPGTYGSILDTLRHTVGADRSYLALLSGDKIERVDEDAMSVAELKTVLWANAPLWEEVLATAGDDPDLVVIRRYEDGREVHAPLGIRLAQVVHHGTDHRSQIATALTALGIEPPLMDVWDFGEAQDRVVEIPAPG